MLVRRMSQVKCETEYKANRKILRLTVMYSFESCCRYNSNSKCERKTDRQTDRKIEIDEELVQLKKKREEKTEILFNCLVKRSSSNSDNNHIYCTIHRTHMNPITTQ